MFFLVLWLAAERGVPLPASMRMVAVGGARISPELLARAEHVGLPVYEGYGLRECGSVVCLNRPGLSRPGSVGQALPPTRVHCDDGGERSEEHTSELQSLIRNSYAFFCLKKKIKDITKIS